MAMPPPIMSLSEYMKATGSRNPFVESFVADSHGGYASEPSEAGDVQTKLRLKARPDAVAPTRKITRSEIEDTVGRQRFGRSVLNGMNAFDRHKKYINDYVIHYGGKAAVDEYTRLDTSGWKSDHDVLREEYRFVRSAEDDAVDTYEAQQAKKYYDKLFKEYCLADMSRYKEGKLGLRWRVENEVFNGKGQFICGNKACNQTTGLHSYEVNFAYVEGPEKTRKNTLVKLRLCPGCGYNLNYKHHKAAERKRKKAEKKEARRAAKAAKRAKGNDGQPIKGTSRSGSGSGSSGPDEMESLAPEDKRARAVAAELRYRDELNSVAREAAAADAARREQEAARLQGKNEAGGGAGAAAAADDVPAEERQPSAPERAAAASAWSKRPQLEKTRDDDFDDYFRGMFP